MHGCESTVGTGAGNGVRCPSTTLGDEPLPASPVQSPASRSALCKSLITVASGFPTSDGRATSTRSADGDT